MSALRMVDDAINDELTAIIAMWLVTGLTLRLFKNNVTPTDGDTVGTYVEADFGGYAPISVPDFGSPAIAGHVATTVAGLKTFTADGTSSNSIYGYYITRNSDGHLYWAQRDDAAPVIIGALAGDQYFVVPLRTHKSQFA